MTVQELKKFINSLPPEAEALEIVVITPDDNTAYATSGVYENDDKTGHFIGVQLG